MTASLFVALTVGVLSIQTIGAGPSGYAPIDYLVNRADAIVVGTFQGGVWVGKTASFTMTVDRVLKGSLAPGVVIAAEWEAPHEFRGSVLPGAKQGLWFLRASPTSSWKVLPVQGGGGVTFWDVYYPVSRDGSANQAPYPPEAPVIAKVVLELGAAAERFGGGRGWGDRMMIALRTVDASIVRDVHQRLAGSPSPRVRVLGLAGLIRLGDPGAMVQAEREVHLFTDPPERLALLKGVQDFRSSEPDAVRALGRLATSGAQTSYLHIPAAEALCRIHTRETLPYLAALLDSSDAGVRSIAVAGMSLFAASIPIPPPGTLLSGIVGDWLIPRLRRAESDQARILATRGPYETEETIRYFQLSLRLENSAKQAEYVNFWRNWWNQHKAELTRE